MTLTLIAVLSPILGFGGGILAQIVSTRRTAHARRRDLLREAYADGLRALMTVEGIRDLADVRAARSALFHARGQIHLVGTKQGRTLFAELADIGYDMLDRLLDEAPRRRPFTPVPRRLDRIYPPADRTKLEAALTAFVEQARKELAIDESWWRRARLAS
ncbi:hypothetical protein ACFQV2_31550 [Actinokineospora soli]|uniref:Uncharacterized protein n=1 Tax=Actinokineospora soli TaxID=1048753 RepID=A0ABW2TWW0_9PSEU